MSRADEATAPLGGAAAPSSLRRVVARCLAAVSVASAVIHFSVAGEHFGEYWAFGVFFLVVAWLQLLWAVVVSLAPARPLLWAGAALNAGVVAVYVVTRTAGDVIGPAPHDVEPVGFGDVACTAFEALVVIGCAWLLLARRDRVAGAAARTTAAAVAGVVAAVLSVSLVAGGPEMSMGDDPGDAGGDAASAMPGMPSSTIELATATPAGPITMPDTHMRMRPGMAMASSATCDATPTKQQQDAAVRLVNTSWQDARTYQSLAAARAAGYRPVTPTGKAVVHYVNPSYYRATVQGGPVLDPARPQSLVYANTPHGAVLAAAMYIAAPGAATPQPGGCLTQWHVHTNLCLRGGRVVGTTGRGCPQGSQNRVTPPMMHVWFVPVPGGPTAVDAPDRQVVQAAQHVSAPKNGTA